MKEKELNLSPVEVSNFLIDLYEMLDERVDVSLTKIHKLVFVVLLKSILKDDTNIFESKTTIENYWCGFKFPEIDKNERIFYTGSVSAKKSIDVASIETDKLKSITEKYKFPTEVIDIIVNVFLEFGLYSAYDLGKMLDDFKTDVLSKKFCINSDDFSTILKNINSCEPELNNIVNYLK